MALVLLLHLLVLAPQLTIAHLELGFIHVCSNEEGDGCEKLGLDEN